MIHTSRLALTTAIATLSVALAAPVFAQAQLEEIVVTARKRQESLLEIPIAITAFSAEQLDRGGIKDLQELSKSVAGLQFSNQGLAIPGRYNSAIRFRGMDVNQAIPTFQLGALFIDGIYVLGSVHSIPLDDIERVEVIKGPQSAYFGRNTFGGAVNYITKTPSTTEYEGELQAIGATYNEYDVSASFSGPLVENKLAFRAGTHLYSRGGAFTASDGGKLGKEASRTVQGQLYLTPNDAFKVKARIFYGQDHDGAPAGGYIPGRLNDTCLGNPVTTKTGQVVNPIRWFCGQVPTQGSAKSVFGNTKIIDSNTSATPAAALLYGGSATYLIDNIINRVQPAAVSKVPAVHGIEMRRNIFRTAGSAEYEFDNGITAAAQGGYNTTRTNWVRDFSFTAFENGYSRDPQQQSDYSVEGRISSDQKASLRGLVGVNYYHQVFSTSASGGDSVFQCRDSIPGPTIGPCTGPPVLSFNALPGSDRTRTVGAFGTLSYDFTEQITLNLEGRYQKDRLRKLGAPKPIDTNGFIPRAILQFKPNSESNLYASFARGVLPGDINIAVFQGNASVQAQAKASGVDINVPGEKLDSYEIGYKQTLFDNRLSINTAAYYGKWSNRKSRIILPLNLQCSHPSQIQGALNGCPPGAAAAGLQANINGVPVFQSTNLVIPGDSEISGLEFEANGVLAEGWTAGLTADLAKNKFTKFTTFSLFFAPTYQNVKGNSSARFPKWSGSINTAYTHALNAEWNWFVRADASYVGKSFVEVDNLAFCKDYWLANSRAGVEKGDFRIEMFVKNILNDKNWTACSRFSEFDAPQDPTYSSVNFQGVVVSPQNPRQFGLKTSLKF